MTDSRYAITDSGVVTNVAMWDGEGDWPLAGAPVLLPDDSPVSTGWSYDGTAFSAPVVVTPVPTPEELQDALVASVQSILDDKAKEYGYDSIASAVTYADEPAVPKFQAEGQALRAWRSSVWAAAYAYLDAVKAGTKTFPTADELPGLLPTFEAPAS